MKEIKSIELGNRINDYYNKIHDLRLECKDYIIDYVKKYGKDEGNGEYKLITYDIDEDGNEMFDGQSVTITYNGGNHPEYNANPYSLLQAINVKDKLVSFDTEDVDGYEFDWVDTSEIINIADFLIGIEEYLKLDM